MIPIQLNYAVPETLDSAVKLLAEHKDAQILAGGHSLLTAIKLGYVSPSIVVDLNKIQELQGIKRHHDGVLQVGAMTTYAQVASTPEVYESYNALVEAVRGIGDAQIRNWGRMGDPVAYRDLACDLLAAFLVFDTNFSFVGPSGIWTIAANKFISPSSLFNLESGEIVTAIHFPSMSRAGSAYEAFKHPASHYTLCGIATTVEQSADGLIHTCRIAATGVCTLVQRLPEIEVALKGMAPTTETISTIVNQTLNDITVVREWNKELNEKLIHLVNRYASTDYCAHLIKVLIERSLHRAIERSNRQKISII